MNNDSPRPALTVDAVLMKGSLAVPGAAEVMLIRRGDDPFAGAWALPGGFVDPGERVEDAVKRELLEETSLLGRIVHLLGDYSEPGRDPRGSTVSVAYVMAVSGLTVGIAGDDAAEAKWWPLDDLPPLAFDHAHILEDVRVWLKQHGLGPLGDDDVESCM